MSEIIEVEPGACIAFGGTNARVADCIDGDVVNFQPSKTPTEPNEFFKWTAKQVMDASYAGKSWMVAGFPGPVTSDGQFIGPMNNVAGMNEQQYDLHKELELVDPAVGRLFNDDKFVLLAVNDGILAAQAAASRIGNDRYEITGAVIVGTGVGAGLVEKDEVIHNLHRGDRKHPLEIGHKRVHPGTLNRETFEEKYAGKYIEDRLSKERGTEIKLKTLPKSDPVWQDIGKGIGRMATDLGLDFGATLVVPTGGVGAGASRKHRDMVLRYVDDFVNNPSSKTQVKYAPEIRFVPPAEADIFELYGAEGVRREYSTAEI